MVDLKKAVTITEGRFLELVHREFAFFQLQAEYQAMSERLAALQAPAPPSEDVRAEKGGLKLLGDPIAPPVS